MNNINSQSQKVTLIGLMLLTLWLFYVVDGTWIYLQTKLIGQKSIPYTPFLFFGFLVAFVVSIYQKKRVVLDDFNIMMLCWLFATYLLAVSIYSSNLNYQSIIVTWKGYFLYYFILLVFPFLGFLSGHISNRFLIRTLALITLGIACLGIAQNFMHDLFDVGRVITRERGAWNIGFAGELRATSLFAHGLDLGLFLSMFGAILVANFFSDTRYLNRPISFFVYIVCLVGCYATLTRAAYIAFVLSSLASVIAMFLKSHKSKVWYLLPFIYLAIGVLIVSAKDILAVAYPGSTLFSSSSLQARQFGNLYYVNNLLHQGWEAFLVGNGWYFGSNYWSLIPIDNGYVAIILNAGLIGLAIWLLLTYSIWLWMSKKAFIEKNPIQIGVVSFFSLWLSTGLYNASSFFQQMILLFLLANASSQIKKK